MILYAIYTPADATNRNRERVFAFASIESFVNAMGDYNQSGATLTPTTQDFLKERAVSMAVLISWNPETKYCEESGIIYTSDNSMKDNWNGSRHEIHLVEKTADEKLLKKVIYP